MNSNPTIDREAADAQTVNSAIEVLIRGDLDRAERLLLAVIANTPDDYSNVVTTGDGVSIKFWDQAAFLHYITWKKDQGQLNTNINWVENAYPRAHYYLGYICVKRKQYDRAIEFLDKGQKLEPTNPTFIIEKAQALVHSGRKGESLALYGDVSEVGPYVSARHLAIARRGQGFVLIEIEDLDGAEAAFKASLEIEPGNDVALNELQYIGHLRQGGSATVAEVVPTSGPDLTRCFVCEQPFDQGVLVSVKGTPITICKKCNGQLTKKWWQFWK